MSKERMKKRRAHPILLSDQALALLEMLKPYSGGRQFVGDGNAGRKKREGRSDTSIGNRSNWQRNQALDGWEVSQRFGVLAGKPQQSLCRTGRSPTTLLPILQRTQADSQQLYKCTLRYTDFSSGLSRSHLGCACRLASFHLTY
jgi:hypothetical protein